MSASDHQASLRTILVVDDMPANIGVVVDCLEDQGFRVLIAQDGVEAIERAAHALPDLILLDVQMPGIDGFEVCRRLKADDRLKDIPVIFMTALASTSDKVEGFAAGGVDYVTKPFQFEELLARVRTHLALRQATLDIVRVLKALNEAQADLARNERLAALDALVAGIAHELNTPIGNGLTVATTLSDRTRMVCATLASGQGLKRSELESFLADAGEASELLVRSLQRAAYLVDSFKHVAIDQTSLQRSTFLLAELVADVTMAMSPGLVKTGVNMRQQIPPDLRMDSYPVALSRVLANLIDNAIVHGFAGRETGTIMITAHVTGSDDVELTVHDDGCGIPATHLERIFNPFFTTRGGSSNAGLGLTVAHHIVTAILGGRISVRSEPGAGTTFTLLLPRVAAGRSEDTSAAASASAVT